MTPSAVVSRLREFCMALPEVWEDTPWGHVVWKVGKKLFVIGDNESLRVTVKATLDEQAALVLHPQIEIASHVGRYGWVTITVDSEETLELALELVEKSYVSVAPKRIVKSLKA